MQSDWHIGSGTGRAGDIDRLVQRDKDNLPFIPAKTLTGIWRDACELVALALDEEEDRGHTRPSWQKWVTYLFGDQPALGKNVTENAPREAALSIRSAHLPKSLIEALASKPELQSVITFGKPGISIDTRSGCAKTDFLRLEEMVRGGCTLTAKCELQLPSTEKQKTAAYALLLAGAKLVDKIGGKRRRGSGKCSLTVQINGMTEHLTPWLDWLEQNPDAPPLPDPSISEPIRITGEPYAQSDDWLQVALDITTLAPVIIPKRTVGNVTESLDHIPGTYLLRLVSQKLSKFGVDLGRTIAHGDFLVTNATIAIDGQSGRTVPFALFAQKLGGGLKEGKVYNRLKEKEPREAQLKRISGSYLGSTTGEPGSLPYSERVDLVLQTHNTIQDEVQRPTSDVGGVYSYESIPAGIHLQACLRLRRELANALKQKDASWWNQLNGRDRLGQSKKDDYGAVKIEIKKSPEIIKATKLDNASELIVWFLSDVLLRDKRL
ncbi:RAMP superfamily CRISPR-associated protein, partial [Leptolyngbya sp. FACHB-711]|uniref:RAMP superfamily CRISPR-associated protein n=1 Tax=Leptolyngbya sp. FACHB-711 TaxID=2692813 RepID=UPI0019CA1DE2